MIRQVLNLLAIFAAFGVNVLANVRPIGGLTLGEISNQLFAEVLITPANYAFAIWGLIYLGLFSFAIYQALPKQQDNPLLSQQINYGLVMASIAQIAWVFVFQLQSFSWSLLLMVLILLPLILSYARLKVQQPRLSQPEKWFVQRPISIYLAWISVATIVNGAVSLTALGWEGWGISPELWTVVMVIVGGAIATWITFQTRDLAFTGVFIWALVAIAVRHYPNTIMIAVTALSMAFILILAAVFSPKQTPVND
ncbi:MAG: tryptophan-rich sensory protein [Kamptonema sp. SIO4C4]|nr:tryptophan-rich sensory protein [Kamptonema sp. SIO4C4]